MKWRNTVKIVVIFFSIILFCRASVSVEASESLFPSPTPVAYSLPYPGLLPGSPLYALKEFRDSLLGFFISDPLEKATFYLLQSDKALNTACLLDQEKQDTSQIFDQVRESNRLLQVAFDQAKAAKKEGFDPTDFFKQFRLAQEKHKEVIELFAKNALPESKAKWEEEVGSVSLVK